MDKYNMEKELSRILGAELEENGRIEEGLQKAYDRLRKENRKAGKKRKKRWKGLTIGLGSVAAALVLTVTFCAMNPVLAKEIPILGGIFEKVADVFSFGKLPEEDVTMLYAEDIEENEDESGETAQEESPYQKQEGGLTITLTEEYATNQAVFVGIQIENEEAFPKLAEYESGSLCMQLKTNECYSFRPDAVMGLRDIEGKLQDEHTFIGIMRVDYSEITADDSKYRAALEEAEARGEELWLTDENREEYIDYYEVPESFTMTLEIQEVIGYLAEPEMPDGMKSGEELEAMSEEEWKAYMESLPAEWNRFPNPYENWYQEGSWSYDVQITRKEGEVITVHETNADGVGIESIELSPVEMTMNTLEKGADTFAVALDADGNKLESGSGDSYVLSISGHDISKIYIYICDYDEYMDELKGFLYSENGSKERFREALEERAVFKTVVETGK